MNKMLYPTCEKTFKKFYQSNKTLTNKYVYKLIKVRPFDVSLRDGLQRLSKEEQLTITPHDKISWYYDIKTKYNPANMEIGSIASEKLLPVFKDSDSLHNYIEYCQLDPDTQKPNHFILIPNEAQFQKITKFIGLNNFSFITSISNSFQQKNTRMSVDTSFQQISNMMNNLNETHVNHKVKVYISCINECPIEGKIDNNIVIKKILKFQELNPDILCLSDTCGTLTVNDFNYIMYNLRINSIVDNISLHLHVMPGREEIVEKIIHIALNYGVTSFDVSAIESGGCSITMNKTDLLPNLSYALYYKALTSYLLQ